MVGCLSLQDLEKQLPSRKKGCTGIGPSSEFKVPDILGPFSPSAAKSWLPEELFCRASLQICSPMTFGTERIRNSDKITHKFNV
jgi:hypothetical protein